MVFKSFIFCASVLMIQSIAGQQCLRPSISMPIASCGCNPSIILDNGGSFIVNSIGPVAPSGIAVATELGLAADLAVSGTLPFLSAVAFDGTFPTNGAASVAYGCGDGNIAITQEIGNPGGSNAAAASGLALNNLGLGSCGCRRI